MRKARVAHVITRLCKGGAQENTFQTVRLANLDRFEVDLISGYTRGREGSIEDAVREAGIDVVRVPALVRRPAPVRDLVALHRLTRLFKERRYDIGNFESYFVAFADFALADEKYGYTLRQHLYRRLGLRPEGG